MDKNIKIRNAIKSDCIEIRKLIQELADFEKMSDGPKIDYQVLEEDGFCNDPLYECFVAEHDSTLVGYALYFYTFNTMDCVGLQLDDLYVSPNFRNKHVGSSLFAKVLQKADDLKLNYVNFWALGWNPARAFYKVKGAVDYTEQYGWHLWSIKNFLVNESRNSKNYLIRQANAHDLDKIRLFEPFIGYPNSQIPSPTAGFEDFRKRNKTDNYLVVEQNKNVIGYALCNYGYSTWRRLDTYLQELFVSFDNEDFNSIVEDLILEVVEKAKLKNCAATHFYMKEDLRFQAIFRKLNVINLTKTDDWHLYGIKAGANKKD